MINKYMRLFVVLAKLMTAEKMNLEQFCRYDECLAFKLHLMPMMNANLLATVEGIDVEFVLTCDVRSTTYEFTEVTINDALFSEFEEQLSVFLNELFNRKQQHESNKWQLVQEKLSTILTPTEKTMLAEHISDNSSKMVKLLRGIE